MEENTKNTQNEKSQNQNDFNSKSKFPFNIKNQYLNKGGLPGNLSPEQYNLLQGLTNPEQLNKFMRINDILDRQNSGQINLTKNNT